MHRRWPSGGLQELRRLHKEGWEYFDTLVMLAQAGTTLTNSQLAYGLRYVVASLWSFAENARPMALEKLKIQDLERMVDGVVLSPHFKTATEYKDQPVTVTLLVHVYIKFFRKPAEESEEALFVTTKGTPVLQGYINSIRCRLLVSNF